MGGGSTKRAERRFGRGVCGERREWGRYLYGMMGPGGCREEGGGGARAWGGCWGGVYVDVWKGQNGERVQRGGRGMMDGGARGL